MVNGTLPAQVTDAPLFPSSMDYLQTTRGRILASIKRHGQGHPDSLALEFDIAPSSVRQHLAALQTDGLVSAHHVRERAGRPRQVFRVTPAGDAVFPKRYDSLATSLLRAGDGPVALLDSFVESTVAARKGRVTGHDTKTRMEQVAAVMRDDGGMAEVVCDDEAIAIVEPNCVYASVAAVEPAVCEAHNHTIQRLLATPTTFTRTSDPYRGGCRWAAVRSASTTPGDQ